jgi:hypothetical protein
MFRALTCAALALLAAGPIAQQATDDSAVHAALRVAGGRTSFKDGEPIRLELVLTAGKPWFIADIDGAEDPSDGLTITPEDGLHKLQGITGRDTNVITKLSDVPTVVRLAVNYWVRFDRPGTYAVSIETRRIRRAGPNGFGVGPPFQLRTNTVTFRVEPFDAAEEQSAIAAAIWHLRSAVLMRGDGALKEQIRAAEELAFLPGDAAAIEKYRWYQTLRTMSGIPSNAHLLLRRGFTMSRNPGVILAQVEAELDDLSVAVTSDAISNAASLAVAVKYPFVGQQAPLLPPGPNDSSPYAVERARYIALVHESLDRRTGLVRLRSAGAMLDLLANSTPADVVRLIVDGFEQLPPETRVWFASGRWEIIRDPKLGPALRRTLNEVEPGSRPYIFPALIDVAPDLAVEPLAMDILDPTRVVGEEIVRKMPRGSLSHAAPQLLNTIREMAKAPGRDTFRIEQKVRVLAVIADGSLRRELKELYDSLGDSAGYGVREDLLRYLLEWDPEEGARLARNAIQSSPDNATLSLLTQHGPLPELTALMRELLFDQNLSTASQSARHLAAHGSPDDRNLVELRLFQWQRDHQGRLANGEALTESDGQFESQMLAALATSQRWTLSTADRARLLAACLTDACKSVLRQR